MPHCFKSLLVLVPTCLLLSGSTIMFFRQRTLLLLIQLVGASCIVLVVLAHVCEALLLFPAIGWGLEHSSGHYVDFVHAVLGLTLFPAGYFLHALRPSRCWPVAEGEKSHSKPPQVALSPEVGCRAAARAWVRFLFCVNP